MNILPLQRPVVSGQQPADNSRHRLWANHIERLKIRPPDKPRISARLSVVCIVRPWHDLSMKELRRKRVIFHSLIGDFKQPGAIFYIDSAAGAKTVSSVVGACP
jgi:hypothetical protein